MGQRCWNVSHSGTAEDVDTVTSRGKGVGYPPADYWILAASACIVWGGEFPSETRFGIF